MELKIFERKRKGKGGAKILRRQGLIPAVIYAKGGEGDSVYIAKAELEEHLRKLPKGHLPNQQFTLVFEDGTKKKALVKGIQYRVTNYDMIHLDFETLGDELRVKVKIPIEFVNSAECVGVKAGGVLRQVIRHIKVQCLPKDIPSCFAIDVKDLDMYESRRLSDLQIPENVRPIAEMQEVAVIVAKR